jgi:hypothetical protein
MTRWGIHFQILKLLSRNNKENWMSYTNRYCLHLDLSYAQHLFQMKNQFVIGGPNMIVKMDESLFIWGKKEMERGLPQQWVPGGTCCGTTRAFLSQSQAPLGKH